MREEVIMEFTILELTIMELTIMECTIMELTIMELAIMELAIIEFSEVHSIRPFCYRFKSKSALIDIMSAYACICVLRTGF